MTAAFNAILADDRPINVRPWLYRIARNRSLNHLRRAQAIGVDSMDHHFSEHGATHRRQGPRARGVPPAGGRHPRAARDPEDRARAARDGRAVLRADRRGDGDDGPQRQVAAGARARVAGRGRRGAPAVLRRGPDRARPRSPRASSGDPARSSAATCAAASAAPPSAASSRRPTARSPRCCRSGRWWCSTSSLFLHLGHSAASGSTASATAAASSAGGRRCRRGARPRAPGAARRRCGRRRRRRRWPVARSAGPAGSSRPASARSPARPRPGWRRQRSSPRAPSRPVTRPTAICTRATVAQTPAASDARAAAHR